MLKSTRLKDQVCIKTKIAQENFNLIQEKLIEYPRISARKNGLDISKSTFNRISKREQLLSSRKYDVKCVNS